MHLLPAGYAEQTERNSTLTETNMEKIDRFIQFNQNMINATVTDDNLRNQGIHAKVLLCAIIDSLAKSRFPNISRNGDRFIQTVGECGEWPDSDRISLLHLKRAIEVIPTIPIEFSNLENWADSAMQEKFRVTNRLLSVHKQISEDPAPKEIDPIWPLDASGSRMQLGDIAFKKLQHKNLLWLYRNSLMHEYRIPGKGSELGTLRKRAEPFYQEVSQVEEINSSAGLIFTNRWELVYPTMFFYRLSENILRNVAEHHRRENTSPFEAYSEGSYWIPKFNEEC